MNSGTVIAGFVLLAYLGMEAYAIRKVGHRTEPAYIHALLVKAQRATELCESDALEYAPRFVKTLSRVTASYREELASKTPGLSSTDIDTQLNREIASAQTDVSEAVATSGCDAAQIKAHFQRYRIYAKKTR